MTTAKEDDFLATAPALSMEAVLNCDDILRQILLRVPAESLIRLKCVSKPWLRLISSPSFAHDHATCQDSYSVSGSYISVVPSYTIHPVPFHRNQSLPPLSFLYDALDIKYKLDIVDSCNGLMLCTHGDRKEFCVFNPTTQKYTLIPPPPRDEFCFIPTFLDFDPTKSLCYKLVFAGPDPESDHLMSYVIDIYSSEDKSWRCMKIDRANFGIMVPSTFWDGTIHWLSTANHHVQFNVDTEKLTETPLPRKASRESMFSSFKKCGDDLLLIELGRGNMRECRIHEMTRATRRWRLKMSVHIRPEESLSVTGTECLYVLSIVKKSQAGDILLVLANNKRVFFYNTKLNTIEVLCDFTPLRERSIGFARHFIPSLSPV